MRTSTPFMILATILATCVFASAGSAALKDEDGDIKGLLGMRPDLADELDPTDEDGNTHLAEDKPIGKVEMSDEEIVERTQRCHNDCKDEPEELIQMCIQKCTYYLINPVDHSLEGDGDEDSSTDTHGLLPDSPHIRTRIRLIGPDGLPIISTVEYDETQASEMSDAVSTAAESASDTWMPVYRVSIVNEATGIKWLAIFFGILIYALWILTTLSYMGCVLIHPGSPTLTVGPMSASVSVVESSSSSRNGAYVRVPSHPLNSTRTRADSTVRMADDQESVDSADSPRNSFDNDNCSDNDDTPLNDEQMRRSEFMYAITVKDNGEPRYCLKCNLPKPDRAHHCSVCGVCVLKMDHHCPWVNNCVGFNNQKPFLLFIAYSMLYCLDIGVTSLVFYLRFIFNAPSTEEISITPLFLIILSLAFSMALVGFVGFHTYLTLNNLTTIESYERNNFRQENDRRGSGKKYINLFDLGAKKNLKQIFGSRWLMWFIPLRTQTGDGMRFPISYENYNELRQN
ncbi:Palmitoyltransferase zdhhc2 [Coemansia sp. RSA 1843]|nr:Palmitoyltransferase zdhhc2 [Coemansia sp. RSA 1843]